MSATFREFLKKQAEDKAARDAEINPNAGVPYVASMSGEAGRQARKLARDCNTGRFRP